jgi:hypothetical protein
LQIIKRFGKKGFSILFWLWVKTQLEAEPGPASRFCLPHSRVAQPRPSNPVDLPTPFALAAQCGPEACRSRAGLLPCRNSATPSSPHATSCRPPNRPRTAPGPPLSRAAPVAAPNAFPSRVPRTDLDRVRGKPSNRRQRKPNPNRLLANPFTKSRIQLEIRIGLLLRARQCLLPYK